MLSGAGLATGAGCHRSWSVMLVPEGEGESRRMARQDAQARRPGAVCPGSDPERP